VAEQHRRGPRLVDRLAQRRDAHLRRSVLYRVLFAIAGGIVTVAGLAMLVLPGPALVVIPIGLAMLSLEFAWAERALEKALASADAAQARATSASRTEKLLATVAIVLAVVAFVVVALLYDIPYLPV
jgi:uncharacterized protein (TIGR02611 family)